MTRTALLPLALACSALVVSIPLATATAPVGFSDQVATPLAACEARLLEAPRPEQFRRHLEMLTREPHVAGSPEGFRVVEYLEQAMRTAGLRVERFEYDVYLAHHVSADVALVTPLRMPLNNQENILADDRFSADPRLRTGWNAFSGSGDVTGEVVFANYGRKEDFEALAKMGVAVKGKVVIARYGGNFRGYKAKYAEEAGAIGLVIYTDPADGGYVSGPVYPEGRFANDSTIQRGSLLTLEYTGDPLTPFEPAFTQDSGRPVKRLDPAQVAFHTIPVAPLPYGSAKEILGRMRGLPVPAGWQGGLPFTYRLTGTEELTVRVRVEQPRKLTRVANVVGTIDGREFPEEWVIFGSHHDAWGHGATDPNSGTAMLLTLADALGSLDGACRPRRTIKIAHWDAEEFFIMGSTEWVEEFRDDLHAKAVAYINADSAVTGPNFGGSSSPSLKRLMVDAARAVIHPDTGEPVYAQWEARLPDGTEPDFGNLGGGSDHVPFYSHVGIPSAGPGMSGSTPIYHSNYDTFAWYERFGDPTFAYGPTLARLNGLVALRLASQDILPFDLLRYATDLERHTTGLERVAAERGRPGRFSILRAELAPLRTAAEAFESARARRTGATPEALARVNARLIQVERALVHDGGLPFGAWNRSVYASPDPWSGYAAWMLPGLRYQVEVGTDADVGEWEKIYAARIRALTAAIQAATAALR
ncbi:transferrin receptor-like dimerization domain-containing protein [soil metagenome]|nr:M28 family peptidase [Acidobacteriota bacterium]